MTSNGLKLTSSDIKMTSKDENDKVASKKVKPKNKLRGLDPNDDNPSNGRHLIEQVFSTS